MTNSCQVLFLVFILLALRALKFITKRTHEFWGLHPSSKEECSLFQRDFGHIRCSKQQDVQYLQETSNVPTSHRTSATADPTTEASAAVLQRELEIPVTFPSFYTLPPC